LVSNQRSLGNISIIGRSLLAHGFLSNIHDLSRKNRVCASVKLDADASGFGILYLFTHDLNAEKILKIYQQATLLKSAEKWFGSDNESWILQEDITGVDTQEDAWILQ